MEENAAQEALGLVGKFIEFAYKTLEDEPSTTRLHVTRVCNVRIWCELDELEQFSRGLSGC